MSVGYSAHDRGYSCGLTVRPQLRQCHAPAVKRTAEATERGALRWRQLIRHTTYSMLSTSLYFITESAYRSTRR